MTRKSWISLAITIVILGGLAAWGWLRSTPPIVVEPTRDPMIPALATSQEQQAEAISALATQIVEEQVVETTAEPEEVVVEPTVTAMPTEGDIEMGEGTVEVIFRADNALDYPDLLFPNPERQLVFPDVPHGDRPALVAYEAPFEDGDYFEDGKGDVDLPQFYFRVMTAGTIRISQVGVNCVSTETQGCLVILINHFGETTMFRNAEVDNGFTVAGRVWDMSKPELVTLAGQALVDHYAYRMTDVPDGANCGTIDACESIEWHVVMVGNGEVQIHWQGEYFR